MNTKIKRFFLAISHFFDKIMFPENIKCIFCNRDVPDFENKPFCEECEKEIEFNNSNRCQICSEPIGNEATVCDMCQKNKRHFKQAFCPFVYGGKVRSAILAYKDSNKRYLSKPFAKFIADEILASGKKIDYVTFVPLSKKKLKTRGFDQAELLAKNVAKLLNAKCVRAFEKVKDPKTQKFSNFKERQQNTIDAYALSGYKFAKTDSVLIVDDIITTCATIDACAKLLHKKVGTLYVASVARNKIKEKQTK